MAKKKRHIFLLEKFLSGKHLSRSEIKELEVFEGGGLPAGIVNSQEKVARALKVSSRTIRHWVKDDMPVRSDGNYDVSEIQAWRVSKHPKNKKDDPYQKEKWDASYREYKALLAEIEYKRAIAEVIARVEVEKGRVQRILVVKRAFLGLPRRVAPQLVGLDVRQIEAIISKRLKEIIQEFSK